MTTRDTLRPLRWFLLVWVGLVYLWGLLYLWGFTYGWEFLGAPLKKLCYTQGCVQILPLLLSVLLLPTLVFTALMLVHAALLWLSLSGRIARRFAWLYLVVQGGLVFAVGLLLHWESIVLSLYLALILAAVAILARARAVAVVGGGYAILFILGLSQQVSPFPVHAGGGTSIWGESVAVLAKTDYAALVLFVVGYLVLYRQQTRAHQQLAATHAKLEAAHAQLMASAARIEELTLVAERRRLARELHDTLAQGVAGLIMQLEAANAYLTQQRLAPVQDVVQQAMASARATLADARGAIEDLRAVSSFEELADAVQEEIRRFSAATGIVCETDLAALPLVPAAAYEPALRAIREGLTNVARHAQAHHAQVRVAEREQLLAVEVWDDGIGFEPSATIASNGHYGLVGLRERARLAGGTLEVSSAPGAGTTVRLCLPCSVEGRVA